VYSDGRVKDGIQMQVENTHQHNAIDIFGSSWSNTILVKTGNEKPATKK
jgi:hypothetical protein